MGGLFRRLLRRLLSSVRVVQEVAFQWEVCSGGCLGGCFPQGGLFRKLFGRALPGGKVAVGVVLLSEGCSRGSVG